MRTVIEDMFSDNRNPEFFLIYVMRLRVEIHAIFLNICKKTVKYRRSKVNICEIANGFVILLILLRRFNEIGFLTLELRY